MVGFHCEKVADAQLNRRGERRHQPWRLAHCCWVGWAADVAPTERGRHCFPILVATLRSSTSTDTPWYRVPAEALAVHHGLNDVYFHTSNCCFICYEAAAACRPAATATLARAMRPAQCNYIARLHDIIWMDIYPMHACMHGLYVEPLGPSLGCMRVLVHTGI